MNEDQIQSNHRFDRMSETYEQSFMQWLIFDQIHRAVLAAVPADLQPEAVLDIGCGTGRLLRKAKERWPTAKLIGVDPSAGMVAKAKAAMPEGEFFVGPVENMSLTDAAADLVLSTISFHHWQDQSQGMSEVARVLLPGGRFYLADTIPPKWIMKVYHHGTIVQPPQLRTMISQVDLKLLSQQRILGWFFYLSVCQKDQVL
jgi:ubiquinone/menaquinone biosynthesis C-methylase UbiE